MKCYFRRKGDTEFHRGDMLTLHNDNGMSFSHKSGRPGIHLQDVKTTFCNSQLLVCGYEQIQSAAISKEFALVELLVVFEKPKPESLNQAKI